jgi:serine/threonine protein kinase
MLTVEDIVQLGPYRLIRELGSGGMGVVFEAEDVMLNRRVALKVLRPGLTGIEDARGRFLREARAMAQLIHDNVVTIFQVHEDRGFAFMAMQLLAGETLEARITREQLKVSDVVRIGREIAEGLSIAHEKGIIHRDIKPANIWLEKARDRVKLLDFGLARRADGDPGLTQSGIVLGTPGYMSPEQARGESLDARSDLFSLGCVLYQLLTGERPFDGSSVVAMLREVEIRHPPRVTAKRPEVSTLLSNLVMELLSKNRKDRPASALIVVDRLMRVISPPVHHLTPTIVSPALLAPPPLANDVPEVSSQSSTNLPRVSAPATVAPPSGSFKPGSGASGITPAVTGSGSFKPGSASGSNPAVTATPSGSIKVTSSLSGSGPIVIAPSSSSTPSGAIRVPPAPSGGNSGVFTVNPPSGPSPSSTSTRAVAGSGMTRLPASMTGENGAQQNQTYHGIGGFLQFGMLFMLLAGLVWGYWTLTNKGWLLIDCTDPKVEVEVKQNGEVIQRLNRESGPVKLQAGDYELVVVNPPPTPGKPPLWVIRNDGKATIRRREEEKVLVYPNASGKER